MTTTQTETCRTAFMRSIIEDGYEDDLDYNGHYYTFFATQYRWLGYKRCWEDHILPRQEPQNQLIEEPTQGTPSPSTTEVECVFVGGPLHGLHMQDISKEHRRVETLDAEFLYTRKGFGGRIYYEVSAVRSPQTVG